MIYKAVTDRKPLPFGGPVVHVAATSERPTGPFAKHPAAVFAVEGVNFAAEDPFVWRGRDRYWAIVKDNAGYFTKAGKSLALFESDDGIVWKASAQPLISRIEITWAATGARQVLNSLERPQLAFDRRGVPVALLCAVDETSRRDWSYNVGLPLAGVPAEFNRP
jgi:hypothetical protein